MGYPKYEEDNRRLLEERKNVNGEKIVINEKYVPYHVRYHLPEPILPVRKKVYFLGRRQIR